MPNPPFTWICGYCGHPTTVTEPHLDEGQSRLDVIKAKPGAVAIRWTAISCPNPKCHELSFWCWLYQTKPREEVGSQFPIVKTLHSWQLLPESGAKPQQDCIPAHLVDVYKKACRIVELAPDASATLSRKCLQGMIHDFWGIKDGRTLDKEIAAIKDNVDPTVWTAIDGVRKMGNIGAHFEKDTDRLLDVTPDEAAALVGLVELLFAQWYVARDATKKAVELVAKLVEAKAGKKTEGTKPPQG